MCNLVTFHLHDFRRNEKNEERRIVKNINSWEHIHYVF
jgi:hypothetical protein